MAVVIQNVIKKSPAFKAKIRPGDKLVAINGNIIEDVLDYNFYAAEEKVILKLLRDEKNIEKTIKKDEYDDLGLEFDTYLMDSHHRCRNNCVFCFVDQMPKGMRNSLYFKDDDSRLSFFFGNYITLTNLSDHDVDRIIKMNISPINISVHTMNPELRCSMMKNRFAGKSLDILKKFAEHGTKINCQIVLCPGYNDGKELEFSIKELAKLHPSVQSVAVVPVGLTKHREGLEKLTSFTKTTAGETIDLIHRYSDKFLEEYGTRIVYPSDEFFITAGRQFPDYEYYEEFSQIENGVGMCRLFEREFSDEMPYLNQGGTKSVAVVTGYAAYDLMKTLVAKVAKKCDNKEYKVYRIKNNFFGESITVAGLITGGDIIDQLKDKEPCDYTLIPRTMLRYQGDVLLDGTTIEQIEEALNTKILISEQDGADFARLLVE